MRVLERLEVFRTDAVFFAELYRGQLALSNPVPDSNDLYFVALRYLAACKQFRHVFTPV